MVVLKSEGIRMITCQLPIQEIADPNVPNILRHYLIAPPSTRRLGGLPVLQILEPPYAMIFLKWGAISYAEHVGFRQRS